MKTITIIATTTVGVENEEQKEELLNEISQKLNNTVWDFDINSKTIEETRQ